MIPRQRSSEPEPLYDFTQWDSEQFRRAREFLGSLALRDDAVTSGRLAVLALYFADNGIEQ